MTVIGIQWSVVSRRAFHLVICALFLALCLPAAAQPAGKTYRIGFLSVRSEIGSWDEAFKLGLRDFGYIEGKNVFLVYRWADGKFDRFPVLANDLVQQNVDIIVTETTPAAQAAKHATQTIPIVMAIGGDAVGAGWLRAWRGPAATSPAKLLSARISRPNGWRC